MIKLSRRSLLKGLSLGAGASLLAPLATRFARAEGERPCRFVFVVEGNGFEPVTMLTDGARSAIDATLDGTIGSKRWWYRDYEHDASLIVEGGMGTARSLGGIAAEGLEAQSTVLLGLSSRVSGGGHSTSHGVLSSARTVGGSPGGPTIDARIASVSNDRPFDVLRLGVGTGAPLNFGTVAYGREQPAPMILNPATAYGVLFGGVADDRTAFDARGDLLSFARQDVQAMRDEFRGGIEREKLDAYLNAIEQLSERQRRLVAAGDTLTAVDPGGPGVNPLFESGDAMDTFALQMELATAAMLGELTNVAVIGCGTGGDFNLTYNAISDVKRHDLQHGSGGSAEFLNAVHTVSERQVELVARMARTFADTPDPEGGSMLDNTLIVYISGNGEQHHSTASEFPVLLIGGQGLGMQPGGRSIVYPGLESSNHRQVSNLWNTVGHLAGQDLNTFGAEGPTRVAEGPLSELLT